jgi:hypothetical protein
VVHMQIQYNVSALCRLHAIRRRPPLPLPVCPLLGPALLWLRWCACRWRARRVASLPVSEFRQLPLVAQRARAGSSVTLAFAQLRGA